MVLCSYCFFIMDYKYPEFQLAYFSDLLEYKYKFYFLTKGRNP